MSRKSRSNVEHALHESDLTRCGQHLEEHMPERFYMTRRKMLGASFGALAGAATPLPALATNCSSFTRGRVFDGGTDRRIGLAGVCVSNGVEIVQTDFEGFYALPSREDVFVIKPSDWSVSFDSSRGLPRFAATEENSLPSAPSVPDDVHSTPRLKTVDFTLKHVAEPKTFTVALFADPQPANEIELVYLQRAMDKMCARKDFAFGLALGDIASDNLSIFPDYLAQASRLGVPVWHIPGNHDHDAVADGREDRLKTWRSIFGPPTYAFEYSGALFIMLDNVNVRPDGSYFGAIGLKGLTFISNLLALTNPDKLVVVCTHIPLTSSLHDDLSCNTSDTDDLLSLLVGRKAISFSGHMHTREHHYIPNGGASHHHQVIAALSGSWWSGPMDKEGLPLSIASDGTPHGWHVLTIEGKEYHTDFVPARNDAIARVIIKYATDFLGDIPQVELVTGMSGHFPLLVNIFDGGPRTSVFVDISNKRHVLRRVTAIDPYTAALFDQADNTIKYWVRPEPSSHLWALDAASFTNPDLTAAQLTVLDEYGRPRLEKVGLFAV